MHLLRRNDTSPPNIYGAVVARNFRLFEKPHRSWTSVVSPFFVYAKSHFDIRCHSNILRLLQLITFLKCLWCPYFQDFYKIMDLDGNTQDENGSQERQYDGENEETVRTKDRSKRSKRGFRRSNNYKSEVIKLARVKGNAYLSWKGTPVASRKPGETCM